MREFHGDLLIGGAAFKALHGELEEEQHPSDSCDWVLDGQLHLSPQEWESMCTNRQYRLELEDGRAGQVVVTRVVSQNEQEVVVDFHHVDRRAKSALQPGPCP